MLGQKKNVASAQKQADNKASSDKSSKKPSPVSETGGLWTVVEGAHWNREGYKKMTRVAFSVSLALVVSMALNIVLIMTRPQPKFLAIHRDGSVIQLPLLDHPIMTDAALKNWVGQVVVTPFNIDYMHWKTQLQSMSSDFTSNGWQAFVKAMLGGSGPQQNGVTPSYVNFIRSNKYVVSGVLKSPPLIIGRGVNNGRLYWILSVHVGISFQNGTGIAEQNQKIVLTVVRASPIKHPNGLAIAGWAANSEDN